MFTGIIEQKGKVIYNKPLDAGRRLIINADFSELQAGESIAVNGVCLTWLPNEDNHLIFDISPETLKITCLDALKEGDYVNLERSMSVTNGRFGGHYVSGHVDAVGCIEALTPINNFLEVIISGIDKSNYNYLVPKGSITVDGVSLTINSVNNVGVGLMLIPHTLEKTTLKGLTIGQKVNIEFDYLVRIVAHQLHAASLI